MLHFIPDWLLSVLSEIPDDNNAVDNNQQPNNDQQGQDDQGNDQDNNQDDNAFLGVRSDQVPVELQPMYKQWQAKYTQTRQAETQVIRDKDSEIANLQSQLSLVQEKAQKLDSLLQDDSFKSWVVNRYGGQNNGQNNANANPPNTTFNYDEYEDGKGLQEFREDIMKGVQSIVNDALQPLSGFVRNTQDTAQYQALVNKTTSAGLPHPDNYKDAIAYYRQQNPGLTFEDAYDLAMGRSERLKVRTPIRNNNQQNNQQNNQVDSSAGNNNAQNNQQGSVLVKPGGGAVTPNPFAGKDPLDMAMEASQKKEGRNKGINVKELLNSVLKENPDKYGGVTLKDL